MSCATSRRATDRCGRSTGSRSRSNRVRSSPSSAPMGPARRRRSARSRAPSAAAARSSSTASRSAGAGRSRSRSSASRTSPRGAAPSPSSRSRRTCGSAPTSASGSVDNDVARVAEYFPWIATRLGQHAGTLSGGEQQMLALARALMSHPRMLLLDEPSLGLAPLITREIFRIVSELNEKEGLTVLVVEQNAAIALEVASYAYVLEVGKVAVSGPSEELAPQRIRPQELPGVLRSDGRVLPAGRRRARHRVDLRRARARARVDPPRDRGDQLRPGRDGDVHDLHRLDADREPRRERVARLRRHARRSPSGSASALSASSSARSSGRRC